MPKPGLRVPRRQTGGTVAVFDSVPPLVQCIGLSKRRLPPRDCGIRRPLRQMAVDGLQLRICLPGRRSPAEVPIALELVGAVRNVIASARVVPGAP